MLSKIKNKKWEDCTVSCVPKALFYMRSYSDGAGNSTFQLIYDIHAAT